MATVVYLVKRYLRKRKRNGKLEYRWVMRWEDSGRFRCESTGTADKTQAEALQKLKWAEVNDLTRPSEPPDQPPEPGPSWQECRDKLQRAMRADNLRPSYISDAEMLFNSLHRMFPAVNSPADITSEMANEYKRRRAEGDANADNLAVCEGHPQRRRGRSRAIFRRSRRFSASG